MTQPAFMNADNLPDPPAGTPPTPILDADDPDTYLAWPRDILEAELTRRLRLAAGRGWADGVTRLLRAGFQGSAVSEAFDQLGPAPHLGGFASPEELTWVRQLVSEVRAAPPAPVPRPYWSQRAGAAGEKTSEAATMDRFVALVEGLERDGLWARAFGVDCPGGHGDPPEAPSGQIEGLLGKQIGAQGAWPLRASRPHWTLDDFYDLAEVLHDLASWPGTWDHHDYGDCIGHPSDFSPTCGQALYRHRVNELLAQSTLDVRVADAGEDKGHIVRSAGDGLDDIIDVALAEPPAAFGPDVAHAVALFRSRTGDVAVMRSAVVALAGVLEHNRSLLQRELLSNDAGALFDIANNFDIRHRNANQRTDYDPAFLEWLFYWYVATVNLVARLQAGTPRTEFGTHE